MRKFLKTALMGSCATFVSACGTIGTAPSIGGNIVDDAMALNQAYGEATSSVIVKNILRARDRWPTTYTTLSEITSTPKLVRGSDISLSPLGLGNPSGPLQGTTSKFKNDSTAANEYKVSPFVKKTDSPIGLFEQMNPSVFAQYFKRWPKDVAILMLVDGITVNQGGRTSLIRNDGENMEEFKQHIARAFDLQPRQYLTFNLSKHLYLEEIRKKTENENGVYAFMLQPNKDLQFSSNQMSRQIRFDLRSLDSIVYYLGETLRTQQAPIMMECEIRTPHGLVKTQERVPLLKITPAQHAQNVNYAVQVRHAGETYLAMPNASQVEAREGCFRERSSTVIAMLDQLLLLSQNEEAFGSPFSFRTR